VLAKEEIMTKETGMTMTVIRMSRAHGAARSDADGVGGGKRFEELWRDKVRRVRRSGFYRKVSTPPSQAIQPLTTRPGRDEVAIDAAWCLRMDFPARRGGPAETAVADVRYIAQTNFGVSLRKPGASADAPVILFSLRQGGPREAFHQRSFCLAVSERLVRIEASTEESLLRAALFLTNTWRLKRALFLKKGVRTVKPSVPVHIGGDLWGGFCQAHEWIPGRENDSDFLELARMGISVMPVMTRLIDVIAPEQVREYPDFRSLVCPSARENRDRLAKLAARTAICDVRVMMMGYNPKLPEDHPVFRDYPACRGATQKIALMDRFRVLCGSNPRTRAFIAETWAGLCEDIPELAGIMMICGGEGFQHCYMRSLKEDLQPLDRPPLTTASDCPRCSRMDPAQAVAGLINATAKSVRSVSPDALCVVWPYSAEELWSPTLDQRELIERLDGDNLVLQSEIDKGQAEWRPAGYAMKVWDYSLSATSFSERCRSQRRLCRKRKLKFSAKIEINISIDYLSAPYLPVLENQRAHWEFARSLKPFAIQSRWLMDGSCKSPSEELGYWICWGKGTEFADPDNVLTAIAARNYGDKAARLVRQAWKTMSEAMTHYPQVHCYIGCNIIGPAQPLVLHPGQLDRLDSAFFGLLCGVDQEAFQDDEDVAGRSVLLFWHEPAYRAIARRGPSKGRDVALDELRALAGLWAKGVSCLDRAATLVPEHAQEEFDEAHTLATYVGLSWRSQANVEEFLRTRNTILEFSQSHYERQAHRKENLADLRRLECIAADEMDIAKQAVALLKNHSGCLDSRMRMDVETAPARVMLAAKIKQVKALLRKDLPAFRQELLQW